MAADAWFRSPLLRGLDARGRADVRAAARLHALGAGALAFAPGDAADTLWFVGSGAVALASGRGVVRVGPAGHFGTEALVRGAVRAVRAYAEEESSLLELPVSAVRRILARADADSALARAETAARREAFALLLAESALGRALDEAALAGLVSVLGEASRGRGERYFSSGEPARHALFVTGGVLELAASPGTTFAVRGDWVALEAALADSPHVETATALGDTRVLTLPASALRELARRHPAELAREREAAEARRARQRRVRGAAPGAARDGFSELERLESARSLLAIELDACVRCGHCTVACAESHGTPRFERRGEHAALVLVGTEAEPVRRALLFPHACQHCRDPACLVDCPTGAISREPDGAVLVREEACTGCGACAKACPWDAIRMAPRSHGAPPGASPLVAAKCDLCHGASAPECVSACPTGAIVRLDPRRDVAEARGVLGRSDSAERAPSASKTLVRWLALAGLLPPLVALARVGSLSMRARGTTGVVAGCLSGLLVAQALVKRVRPLRVACAKVGARAGRRGLSLFVGAHSLAGFAACGAVVAHAGAVPSRGLAGALELVFWVVALSGGFGAVAYRSLPGRLRRLEREGSLPEDGPAERDELEQRLFGALSSQNGAVKGLARRVLIPYAGAPFGPLALLASGRGLAAEEAALTRRVERLLGGRRSERLAGAEVLVKTSVALRALAARRLVERALAWWLPFHLVLAVFLAVLLVVHVVGVMR
ncbi:MAG TPA: cyclic nucleotide-binding domain-containing protein [Polyangiaceae bacterium]|nr:cyclic nucleotide-binding domain-containing protein [Polyangiaceae bacterium]